MLHDVYAMSADELVIMADKTKDALFVIDLGHGLVLQPELCGSVASGEIADATWLGH